MARPLSRRAFCLCCLAAPWGLSASEAQAGPAPNEIVAFIMAEAARATIHIHPLRGGLVALEGSGGNVAVLPGPEGMLLVDAGIGVSRTQVAAALASLGPLPVVQLINTHWHFDHTGGNEWLRDAGAAILAQANAREHMKSAQRVPDWDYVFPAAPARALPDQVFAEQHLVRHAGATLELTHYGPAHTDSDIAVRFREADILHTGDTYWNGVYPMIDYATGGHIDGMIRAAEANLAAAGEDTIVIPGHGAPVSNRAGLRAYRDMLVAIRALVAQAKRGGASLDAVVASRPTAPWDASWGQFVISPALFTRLVYEGL
jgi:glyoxylase-like metal-dependent hydrolase (beta-lactamase superfamily II)